MLLFLNGRSACAGYLEDIHFFQWTISRPYDRLFESGWIVFSPMTQPPRNSQVQARSRFYFLQKKALSFDSALKFELRERVIPLSTRLFRSTPVCTRLSI